MSDATHRPLSWTWRAIHAVIIANFLLEIVYAAWMVFFVVTPPGGGAGPLGGASGEMPFETMVTRRLYAIECWIAIAGLAIYLAITEVLPRRRMPVNAEPSES